MTQSIYDKKTWLRHHIEEIIELQKNGLKQQQIIDVLRQSYGMPFEIEKSLFSRHLKSLITETQLEQDNQHKQQDLEKLQQYCKYLEQSNQQLIRDKQVQNQTLRTRFKQQQQLQKQLTEKQEALNVLQNQLEFQQIEAEKQHKTILKLETRIEYLEHAQQQNPLKAENKRLQKLLTQYQADDQKKTQTLLKTQKESKQRLYLALSFVFLTIFFLILNIFRC
ncbi:hypothetical protein [Acinetobacter faecalis]|jgi:septal ring factor EnvC (AmiA/AmiB activator)|uniref:hypothetical protein n=1 Tax=Acinetobacter faecalis TaxID=2665161 RepID=UPI002A91BB14|nr:hypothetical protein [Acinetobacter faecalis]MDY6462812.1 hypothetical protein [Acinetobacter faecalis]